MKNKPYYFKLADLTFLLEIPEGKSIDRLLPSLLPFLCQAIQKEQLFLRLRLIDRCWSVREECLIAESNNDLGRLRLFKQKGLYMLNICSHYGTHKHLMCFGEGFMNIDAFIDWNDPYAGDVLNSMLRMAFSQAVIRKKGVSLHASAVVLNGKAYLFMGKSGTGKSTHASLWLDTFKDAHLLNDDNPVIRVFDEQILVYGTAWSGKTPCYKNEVYPLGGIIRLFQTPYNRFSRVENLDAMIMILPGCSFINKDVRLKDQLCDTLVELISKVPVGKLECLPERAAAELCMREITTIR